MSRFSIVVALFINSILFTRLVADEKPRPIALDQIWGYNLPGTRDIAGIPFPDKPEGVGRTLAVLNREREYNIEQIRIALSVKPPNKTAASGFVVASKLDSHTLANVLPPLRGKPNPFQREFPEGEFTLVFFSHPLSYYARIRKVERDGNQITVHYQFEPHTTPEATVHFALIPLGKLTADKYHVTYKQEPIDKQYREIGFEPVDPNADSIVCRDFSFTVGEPKEEPTSTEGANLIPLREIWGYEIPRTLNLDEVEGAHPLILSLHRTIFAKFKKDGKAGPAFVVEGTGKAALENMISKFDDPPRYVPADKENSLVFYTRLSGFYVRIESVERNDHTFTVKYRFETHRTGNLSFHFALIPIKLPAGTYKVEVKQLPPIDEDGRKVALDRDFSFVVCQDSTFYVKGTP
jgi:hypothetical protein